MISNGNFTVIGRDVDGNAICQDEVTGERYNCGEPLPLDDARAILKEIEP